MQVIVDNMDALLDEPPFSAVAAMPYSSRLFNSGVFVFEPSLAVASALAALSRATDTGVGGKPAVRHVQQPAAQRGPMRGPVARRSSKLHRECGRVL